MRGDTSTLLVVLMTISVVCFGEGSVWCNFACRRAPPCDPRLKHEDSSSGLLYECDYGLFNTYHCYSVVASNSTGHTISTNYCYQTGSQTTLRSGNNTMKMKEEADMQLVLILLCTNVISGVIIIALIITTCCLYRKYRGQVSSEDVDNYDYPMMNYNLPSERSVKNSLYKR